MTETFASLEDLNQWLAERNMTGFWNNVGRPSEEIKPQLWKWDDIHRALMNAAELVPMEMVAMRTIQLRNPSVKVGMSNTLHFSVQCLMPGERTKAHRNLVGETRFVLKAPMGAIFIVDGEPFPMSEGDLITTPNWSWHDHYNGGDEPAIWLDGMDTRLVNTLGKGINERFPQDQQPLTSPQGFSRATLGHARPSGFESRGPNPPPFHYRWEETYSTLTALRDSEADGDPCDGLHLTFSNPVTSGPTLPTYACEVQLMASQLEGRAHRHNSTTIYHAFRGQGATTIADERIEWAQGDVFLVPPWTWHQHCNRSEEDAILYSITDRPALSALGLYREERKE